MGRNLTLSDNLDTSQSHTKPDIELGAAGEALSNLRPAGIALIEGKRIDVMADADWIEAGKSVHVVAVQNATITVREDAPCETS